MKLDLKLFEDFRKFLDIFGPVLTEVDEKWRSIIDVFTSEDVLEEVLRRSYQVEDFLDRNSISFKIIQDVKMNLTTEQIVESISRRFPNLKEMIYNLDEESLREFLLKMLFVDLNQFIRDLLKDFEKRVLELGVAKKEGKVLTISKEKFSEKFGGDIPEDIELIF